MKREEIRAGIVVRAIYGNARRAIAEVSGTVAMTTALDGTDAYPLDISALEMFWESEAAEEVPA